MIAITRSWSMPNWSRSRRSIDRTKSPAPTSSSADTATCATSSACRNVGRVNPSPPRPVRRRSLIRSPRKWIDAAAVHTIAATSDDPIASSVKRPVSIAAALPGAISCCMAAAVSRVRTMPAERAAADHERRLGAELRDDAGRAGAEREANGHLAPALHRARELQVDDVGDRDEQDEHGDALQPQRDARRVRELAGLRAARADRREHDARRGIRFGRALDRAHDRRT